MQYDPFAEHRPQKIAEREDEYKARRRQMIISPERLDPFADGKFSYFLSSLHLSHSLPLFTVHFFVTPMTTMVSRPWFCCSTLRSHRNNLLPRLDAFPVVNPLWSKNILSLYFFFLIYDLHLYPTLQHMSVWADSLPSGHCSGKILLS